MHESIDLLVKIRAIYHHYSMVLMAGARANRTPETPYGEVVP